MHLGSYYPATFSCSKTIDRFRASRVQNAFKSEGETTTLKIESQVAYNALRALGTNAIEAIAIVEGIVRGFFEPGGFTLETSMRLPLNRPKIELKVNAPQ